MIKPIAKTKAIRMPGKERPAASRLEIQGPPTPEPHPRNTGENTKPSDSQPIGPTAKGLDYRFLRSQLLEHLNIADTNLTLLRHTEAR
jgi:hypothetical protein